MAQGQHDVSTFATILLMPGLLEDSLNIVVRSCYVEESHDCLSDDGTDNV